MPETGELSLFWKKIKIYDVELDDRNDDHRSAYRIAPDRSKPIIITIMGSSFHAVNISGKGICFRTHNFSEGSIIAAMIKLPSEDRIFPVTLRIVSKQGDLCRCRFEKIHAEAENLLHAHILKLQKNKIRQNSSKTPSK
ncbi:MAG: hypothetical protein ACI8XC_002152 [Gammaproteobacteria bacterium]